jgi:phenylpyruvate tautomerase PptA (4-oxalocrotonate tautomerase family)
LRHCFPSPFNVHSKEKITLPTINADFLDSRVTPAQNRQLAKSLTKILSEVLGYSEDGVTIIFRSTSAGNIARDEKLRRPRRY